MNISSDRPQHEFPNALVRVLKYGADERGVGRSMSLEDEADVRVEGSLPRQIMVASDTIDQMMPKWRQLGPTGLFEARSRIPRDAWLEGLVNAVVHRSYSMMGDHIRFEIFPNRVEITSPGRFPGLVNPDKPALAILDALRLAGRPLGTGQLAELAGVTRMTATRALAALEQEGIVTWRGTSKRDPRATWSLGQL